MLYAFTGYPELQDTIRIMKNRGSYSDLAQDMSYLNGFGIIHKDLLDKVGINFAMIKRAGELKTLLPVLLAKIIVGKQDKSEEELRLDLAFCKLSIAVEQVCVYGKNCSGKDPNM